MINEIQKFVSQAAEGKNLSQADAARAFQIIMHGGATPAQMAALLVALRMKGETVDEITGAATAMRAKMLRVTAPADCVDTCGTGGDGKGTLNISTAAALVTAACGVPVAKHGNRAVSSASGSADVLKALDVNIEVSADVSERLLLAQHFCFLMAPRYHPAMRHVAPVRQELGMRTLFNLLGPLCNPASPTRQLMGVYAKHLVEPIAHVLKNLGSTHAWVVHGEDGLDEISLSGITHIAELKNGAVRSFTLTPEDAGIAPAPLEALKGGDAAHNARAIEALLNGVKNPFRDAVALNAGAALVVAEKAADIREGVALAAAAIDSGKAKETLAAIVYHSNEIPVSA